MKKTLILSALLLSVFYCLGDQLSYLTKDQALKATIYLRKIPTVVLWCACCEGDNPKRTVTISNVFYEYTGTENFFQVILEGVDNNQKKIKEEIDLAYVHVNIDGDAKCLGLELGLECDPCTQPFPYPKGKGSNTAKETNAKNITPINNLVYYYEKEATLKGELMELRYTNLAGDWNTTYILVLDHPIKVISTNENYETQENVKEVQIGFDSERVHEPGAYVLEQIKVTGVLYGESTVNDRRPVIMVSAKIE